MDIPLITGNDGVIISFAFIKPRKQKCHSLIRTAEILDRKGIAVFFNQFGAVIEVFQRDRFSIGSPASESFPGSEIFYRLSGMGIIPFLVIIMRRTTTKCCHYPDNEYKTP